MVFMAHDDGEALFERYLEASGYDIVAYHPDLGTQKRPDYLISARHKHVVVEVESFNTPPLSADHPRSGFFSMTPKLRAVRDKVSAGAKQLKGIRDYPLVVVLANPRNSWVPLEGAMFLGALFGDMQYSFTPDGDGIFHAGRNGRLHITKPDGSTHGNHPYLSAVAVLRLCYSHDVWVAAMSQSQDAGYTEPLALLREANRLVTQQDEIATKEFALMCTKQSVDQPFRFLVTSLLDLMTLDGALSVGIGTARSVGHLPDGSVPSAWNPCATLSLPYSGRKVDRGHLRRS